MSTQNIYTYVNRGRTRFWKWAKSRGDKRSTAVIGSVLLAVLLSPGTSAAETPPPVTKPTVRVPPPPIMVAGLVAIMGVVALVLHLQPRSRRPQLDTRTTPPSFDSRYGTTDQQARLAMQRSARANVDPNATPIMGEAKRIATVPCTYPGRLVASTGSAHALLACSKSIGIIDVRSGEFRDRLRPDSLMLFGGIAQCTPLDSMIGYCYAGGARGAVLHDITRGEARDTLDRAGAGSAVQQAILYDLSTGAELASLPGTGTPMLSPDTGRVYRIDGSKLRFYDVEEGKPAAMALPRNLGTWTEVHMLDDRRVVGAVAPDETVRVFPRDSVTFLRNAKIAVADVISGRIVTLVGDVTPDWMDEWGLPGVQRLAVTQAGMVVLNKHSPPTVIDSERYSVIGGVSDEAFRARAVVDLGRRWLAFGGYGDPEMQKRGAMSLILLWDAALRREIQRIGVAGVAVNSMTFLESTSTLVLSGCVKNMPCSDAGIVSVAVTRADGLQ